MLIFHDSEVPKQHFCDMRSFHAFATPPSVRSNPVLEVKDSQAPSHEETLDPETGC